jgi:exopolysaccharide production protein ExoZ
MMKSREYFYGVEFIRFCAALLVVFHHLGCYTDASFGPIFPAVWFGWVGVEIFFVISGFVIANSANGSRPIMFLRGRILRLYPAAWLCATITLVASVAVPDASLVQAMPIYLRTLALLPSGPWIDTVYWTLAVEIGFYLLIFCLLCAGAFSYLGRVALLLTIFSSMSLCFLGGRHWAFIPPSKFAELIDSRHYLVQFLLARYGCFFALGIWIWISNTRPLRTWERAASAVSIVACIGEICLRGSMLLPLEVGSPSWIVPAVPFWIAAIICLFFFSRAPGLTLPSGVTAGRIRTIGLMTYPLYLVHNVVGKSVVRVIISTGINKWAALAFGVLSMIFLSWVICKFCEPLIRKILAPLLDKVAAQHVFVPPFKGRKP